MRTKEETAQALNAIRKAIDADVIDADIVMVQNKMLGLTQLIGLSAEAKATAKKLLHIKETQVLYAMDKELSPSVQVRKLNSECFEELALLEYADRLNAALTHNIDALRSVISFRKTEIENSLK